MNDNKKNLPKDNYNWKGVMDFIKEEVKLSTSEWTNEKNILVKKINDLEKEVKVLKKTNQELIGKISTNSSISNAGTITINPSLALDRKLIAEKLLHKRGDSDKLAKEKEEKLAKFKSKTKQYSDDITKSDILKKIHRRKTNSFGGFEKLFENKLLEYNPSQIRFNQNISSRINGGNGGANAIINPTTANTGNTGTSNLNFSLFNTMNNTARINTNDDSQEIHSHRITNNHVNKIHSNKALEFSKVLATSKLSEKEEESSIATQETILQKPFGFINTSSSFSQHNISNNNNSLNDNFLITDMRSSMQSIPSMHDFISDYDNINRLSINLQSNKQNLIESTDILRKSMNSRLQHTNSKNVFNGGVKSSHNPILVLKYHFDSVRDVYLTPNFESLVSVGEDMLINFWDFKNAMIQSKESFEPYFSLRTHTTPIFTLTGKNDILYSSGVDGVIRINKIPSLNNRSSQTDELYSNISYQPIRAHQDIIWGMDTHPTENLISSLASDGVVKISKGYEENTSERLYHSIKSKNTVKQITFKNTYYNFIEVPTHSSWSINYANHLYVSYLTPYIKQYDIETGKAISDITYTADKNIPFESQQINRILYHETSNMLISGHEDRQIKFFDPHQKKMIKSMVAHTDSVSALSNSTKEYEFLSGSHDGSIRCWDLRIFKLLFDIPAHRKKFDEGCLSIRAYKTQNLVISTGADGLIKIFNFN